MDEKHWKINDGKITEIPPIKELCQTLEAKFLEQEEENNKLREENQKLKENIWKEEEVARLKTKHDEMKEDWLRGFPISKEEDKAIKEWMKSHKCEYHGLKIGGSYHYEFNPTAIGLFGTIKCNCGETFTFQEP